ncbi:hypothetical protein KSD_27960 [Ktedonobacter sp. SOSP1-85]|nr:hypothetical protein KSD_27960 [Ktedonobacter sp. SOSP1-85]
MCKALLLLSGVNVVLLGADEILYGLLDLTKRPQLNQVDQIIKIFTLASLFISLVLLGIYVIRQMIAQDRQLRKQGIVNISNIKLWRMKSPKVKPYKRESILQFALFLSFPIFGLFRPIADLMYLYAMTPPKSVTLLHWVGILSMHLCLLIYAILNKDLTKGSSALR